MVDTRLALSRIMRACIGEYIEGQDGLEMKGDVVGGIETRNVGKGGRNRQGGEEFVEGGTGIPRTYYICELSADARRQSR